jgi:hypothetical protein
MADAVSQGDLGPAQRFDGVEITGTERARGVPRRVLRRSHTGQEGEGELGPDDQELVAAGPREVRADVLAGEQEAMLDQVEPVERREAAAGPLAPQGRRSPPEHRQPLVQRRASGLHSFGHAPDRLGV